MISKERARLFKQYLIFFIGAGISFVIAYTGDSIGAKWLQIVGTALGAIFILLCALTFINIGIASIQELVNKIMFGIKYLFNFGKNKD